MPDISNENNGMTPRQLDLNLLRVLQTIHATRSVSRAARLLGMTQSAVSNALRRLRERLDDPLFVRCAEGMQPTALTERLVVAVESGLATIDAALASNRRFDPAASDRLFRLLANDLAQLVMVPALLRHLATAAPDVRLETVDASPEEGKRAMDAGTIDLAFGNWAPMGPDYHRQRLFSETFVVLMRRENPLFARRLTQKAYLAARHVDYRPGGASYHSFRQMLDQFLAREGGERRVVFTAGHALGLASIIAESDLLLTLPSRLAQSMTAGRSQLGIKPLPFPGPTLSITQQWHARAHHDPAAAWLRQTIVGLFGE